MGKSHLFAAENKSIFGFRMKGLWNGLRSLWSHGGWERYKWLRHGFSTRAGGVSTVYSAGVGELNLGWTTEDDPACVRENRGRFLRLVGGELCGEVVCGW